MRSSFITIAALLVSGVAHAEPMQMAPGQSMGDMKKTAPKQPAPHDMESMSMEQQMAVCSKIETLQKQGKVLTAAMKEQKAVCDKMNGSMSVPAQPAPDATLER